MAKLPLEIWSDIACPWCYIGKRRLETALAAEGRADAFAISWRAFELNPQSPAVIPEGMTQVERLAKKYGRSLAEAGSMVARVRDTAAAEGLAFDFDRIRPGNTFDAHRLVHLGRVHGIEDNVKERFLKAYLCEGEPIGDKETLQRLAAETGLDPVAIRAVLSTDAHAAEVRAEEREAAELDIRGVPFFVINRRYAVSGAQPPDLLAEALDRALEEASSSPEFSEGAACGPDGC